MTFFSNLSLFAHCIAATLVKTGIGPGILIFYAARMLARYHRVPTLNRSGYVVSAPRANSPWVGTHPTGQSSESETLEKGGQLRCYANYGGT